MWQPFSPETEPPSPSDKIPPSLLKTKKGPNPCVKLPKKTSLVFKALINKHGLILKLPALFNERKIRCDLVLNTYLAAAGREQCVRQVC